MPSKSVVVGSAVGLHARPAAIIAEAAEGLAASVTINGVDASSSLMIMTLGAGNGDMEFFGAGAWGKVSDYMGEVRLKAGKEFSLVADTFILPLSFGVATYEWLFYRRTL